MELPEVIQRWWRWAGFVTWAVVGITFVADVLEDVELLRDARFLGCIFAHQLWAVAFELNTHSESSRRPRRMRVVLLLAQSLLAGAIAWFPQKAVGFIFLVVVSGQLSAVVTARVAVAWIGVQSLVMASIYSSFLPFQLAAAYIGVYVGFQAFAYMTVRGAQNESQARLELARVNAELRAKEVLLEDSSRIAERMRIAREVHDVLGHDLTALCLNLECALHRTSGEGREHVERAQLVAKRLLADIREVVSDLRGEASLNVGAALDALASGLPHPTIHVDVQPDLRIDEPALADALLRCAQEAITNAVRHGRARNAWIKIDRHEGRIRFSARDDGRGANEVKEGCGLRGMRERIENAGGNLRIVTAPQAGFSLEAEIGVRT